MAIDDDLSALLPQAPPPRPAQRDAAIEQALHRFDARERRDFAEADRIRGEIVGRGIAIEDGPGGTKWKRVR